MSRHYSLIRSSVRAGLLVLLPLLMLQITSCRSGPKIKNTSSSLTQIPSETGNQPARSPTLQRLTNEAKALEPLATSDLSKRFLHATADLPSIAPRIVFQNPQTREYFSPAEAAAGDSAAASAGE